MSSEIKQSPLSTKSEILDYIANKCEYLSFHKSDTAIRPLATEFYPFVQNIFAHSFEDGFTDGVYVKKVCNMMEHPSTDTRYDTNKNLIRVSRSARLGARHHFKSTSFYGHFMWKAFNTRERNLDCDYFSYNKDLASHHLRLIKRYISMNPYFKGMKDKKTQAEGIIKYTWDGVHSINMRPHGLLSFKRGLHPDIVYVDDPFQDPKDELNLRTIETINNIFITNVLPMPKHNGELHVVGTAQTESDFFFREKIMEPFDMQKHAAILDETKRTSIFPEWMSYDELISRRDSMGERLFNREYMCNPVYTENAFLNKAKMDLACNNELYMMSRLETGNNVYLGWDLGKKIDPSHISIMEEIDGELYQRYHRFLDQMPYEQQIELINFVWEEFSVDEGMFDNTRGEMEQALERNELPSRLKDIHFAMKLGTQKANRAFSVALEYYVNQEKVHFINDYRQKQQMLSVDLDLNAPHSPMGHGDCFWSNGMVCYQARHGGTQMHTVELDFSVGGRQ